MSNLIPRQTLFGNPDKASPRISPDGTKLAFLAAVEGVLNVWVGPADEPAVAKPVTQDTVRGIRHFFWAYTNEHILYLQDKGGDENWRLYAVDLSSNQTTDLTPFDNVQARVEEVSHAFPDEVLVALNDRQPELHDLYRINIRTAERTLVIENEGFAGFTCDEQYNVRLGLAMKPDGGVQLLQRDGDGWAEFADIGPDDALTTGPAGFDHTGQTLYMIDSRDRETAALTEIDCQTGETKPLYEDPRADLSDHIRNPTSRKVEAVASNYTRKEWKVLDPDLVDPFEYLRTVDRGDLEILSRSLDDQVWVVAYYRDNGPVAYYLYDRASLLATFLFNNREPLAKLKLSRMHPVVIPARDRQSLVSYLSLPAENDQDGKPSEPLPMVLLVHGGPWARDEWGFDPEHQWLANRGYAVLSVNFRGSTGLGKSFTNLGNKQWSQAMHVDLLDAVGWAVENGIAQRDKIAIMGGSYGGYATLVGLTYTPDVFACGVDIVGPSNLITLLESIPDYWQPMIDLFTNRVGDHRTEQGRKFLLQCSPLERVDAIQKPLLIGQGANDPRVKQAESDQIVQAMQTKNIPVTYVLYGDEGHGFARPENRMSFNAVVEAFLAKHLGGACEPIGVDFKGSSIEVPAGKEQVEGLEKGLGSRD
jgi:dipeptidyl aminopeptidase/acylaminoacyl peptidase